MTPELWQRLKPLFHAAMEKEEDARAAFVEEICGADSGLKHHLLLLLQAEKEKETAPLHSPVPRTGVPPEPRPARFRPGEVLLDRFRIVRLLGKGGMGEVFEAEDLQLGRIALKTVRPDIYSSSQALERFRHEVQLARKVSGPQVCRIHELFLLPAAGTRPATAFLTMEYLEGQTLSSRLTLSGPFSRAEALPLALDICAGLQLIHQQGIVHRDLKCANIMLCERDGHLRAVLMDFGLAFDVLRDSRAAQDSTVTGTSTASAHAVMAGTPAYMAPEQFEGKPISAATDIYALGVVLYELLTARQPFASETPVGAALRRALPPPPASSVQHKLPRHWDHVIERCLEFDPERRYRSASEVAAALRASPLRLQNLRRDRPRLMLAAVALLLLLTFWGLLAWWRTRQYYHPSAEAEHWYQTGLAALREASYVKATRSFTNATTQDNRFVMAHARLAEAWSDLDFDGAAQREMLIASAGENHLAPLDRRYLDAIRATLTGDFTGALGIYRRIVDRLPESGKAAGYVDLGMAYERAGDPQHALQSYAKASALNPDNPASWLRTGMLQSRLNHVPQANYAFSRAESLYAAEMNPEGQAELDYQRGYLANEREADDEANADLNRALSKAQQLPSVQLEIRALTQLSSVACASGHFDLAVNRARRAIQLARDNQLNGWGAEGFVLLANAEISQHNLNQADADLQEAFQILHQDQQDRIEAMANFTLANLRNQQNRPAEIIGPATAALRYYKANGFFFLAAQSSLFIGRAQRSLGQLQQAIQTGNELAELSNHAGALGFRTQAQELLGTTYLLMENYPQALDHLQSAFSLAGDGPAKPYEAYHEAEVFTRIGDFPDAERMLALTLPTNQSAGELRVEVLLGQRKLPQAEALATKLIRQTPSLDPDVKYDLETDRALAQAMTGDKKSALAYLGSTPASNDLPLDSSHIASRELDSAAIALAAGDPQAAFDSALKAESYYSSQSMPDSDLRSALVAARAARILHNEAAAKEFTQKSVDILGRLRQTWSPHLFRSYTFRPDIEYLVKGIPPIPN